MAAYFRKEVEGTFTRVTAGVVVGTQTHPDPSHWQKDGCQVQRGIWQRTQQAQAVCQRQVLCACQLLH